MNTCHIAFTCYDKNGKFNEFTVPVFCLTSTDAQLYAEILAHQATMMGYSVFYEMEWIS